MASGTKIRTLARLLDSSAAPLWVIGPAGNLVYLSAGVSTWLGIDATTLLERRSVAGSPISDDPLDYVAASMSPPPGFQSRGTASLRIQPPPLDGRKIAPLDVRFIRAGEHQAALTFAIAGVFADSDSSPALRDAVAVRQRLDWWRKRHAAIATIATAGISPAARRLRARVHVAASTRSHIGFFGPTGCGAESIASRIHQLSAPGEPLITVDGPLMDAELLDATVIPLVNQLASSADARATALVRGLDQMPAEAGARLAELLRTFAGRLRLLGLCSSRPSVLAEPLEDEAIDAELTDQEQVGILPALLDFVSPITVTIAPLSTRVEDIPLIATAMIDARRAAGEGTADRISRTALDLIVTYPWPGNYAELDDAMRQALGAASSESIGIDQLPLAVRSFHLGDKATISNAPSLSLDESLKRMESRLIDEAIEQTGGNRAEAARRLGISRARLLRRLDEGKAAAEDPAT
jgi:hypothetical protein